MIQMQIVTELSRIPDVDATVRTDDTGHCGLSVYRYGGVVVLESGKYARLGEGGSYDADFAETPEN